MCGRLLPPKQKKKQIYFFSLPNLLLRNTYTLVYDLEKTRKRNMRRYFRRKPTRFVVYINARIRLRIRFFFRQTEVDRVYRASQRFIKNFSHHKVCFSISVYIIILYFLFPIISVYCIPR